jgi:HAE1 family hydrophobic/amphiphilic exporter-1
VAELGGRVHDVELRVVSDRSGDVTRALAELALSALFGILLGTLVLRWMIGHWRPTLALAVVIPAALLASFTVFFAAGIPLDVISLAGLALATGLLVDNSIVVLESIESAGDVIAGTRQIVVAVVASSITLMIVFAPLLYLRGLARAMFGEQAVAVVASVGASLLLSLTLTPVLALWSAAAKPPLSGLDKAVASPSHSKRSPGLERYLALLDRVIAQPRRALTIGAILTLAAIALVAFLPRELFARGATKHVRVELPRDTKDFRVGLDLGATTVTKLAREETPIVMDVETSNLNAVKKAFPGATVRAQPSAFIEAAGGDESRIELVASGTTDFEAARVAQRITSDMQKRGFRLIDDDTRRARLAYVLSWDDRLLVANNIDRASVERDVRAALGDFDAGEASVPFAEPEIRLLPSQPQQLSLAPVRVGDRIVPLAAIAAAQLRDRTPIAYRDEGRPARRLTFEGNAGELTPPQPRAPTERIRLAGHARELRDAFSQMRLAFVLAAILLYLTVAAFYESLLLPLLVIAALPFAAGGALVALLITGQSLNVMSLIGLIFLGGVVVNHTVVLLDRVEQLRAQHVDEDEAVRRAAHDRYRPVMMTTITAILAMLPLALAGGAGVELRRSIAVVVIGGLTSATIGTLVLIPLLHRAVEKLRSRA